MPYAKRHRRRPRSEWTDSDKFTLELGVDVFRWGDAHFATIDDPLAAEAWHELRIEVIDRTIREFPGTRPAAWYRFEGFATFGPRRRISDDETLPEESTEIPHANDGYESQEQYLRRVGALEPSELFALARLLAQARPNPKTDRTK